MRCAHSWIWDTVQSYRPFQVSGTESWWRHISGDATLEATVESIKRSNHRLVRHQYSWFRPDDRRIDWFDVSEGSSRCGGGGRAVADGHRQ